MADVKISQLPAATTPLAGTEQIPLVQSTTTKQITVSNLLTAANLGTPTAINLTNATNVPVNQATGILPVANGGNGTATPSLVGGTNITVSGSWPNQTITATGAAAGDVTGPSSATDNAVARFDNTTGKVIQNSGVIINDSGEVTVGVWKGTEITVPYGGTGASTLTGIVKGNGQSAMTAAVAGTDYVAPGGALGTPSSGTATNLTGLPLTTGVTGVLPIANGGTNASTAATARSNILPSYAGNANKVLAVNSGATDAEWISSGGTGTVTSVATGTGLTGGPITTTGTIALANTAVTAGAYTLANITVDAQGRITAAANGSAGTGTVTDVSVVSANGLAGTVATSTSTPAITLSTTVTGLVKGNGTALSAATAGTDYVAPGGALGTPSSGTATNLTGLPLTTGVTGTLPVANGGTGTTTPALVAGTNVTITGTWPNQTINASSTAQVYPGAGIPNSTGSAWGTSYSTTGTGDVVLSTSPTLVTPALGTPSSATLTNATGLPIATGVSGLGTGVATALAVNVGTAGAPVVNGGALGTPSSGTATNLTGLPLSTGVTGTLPTTNGGTGLTSFTSGGVVYASSTSALATGSGFVFDGTNLGLGVTPSAWVGNFKAFQVGTGGTFYGDYNNTTSYFGNNAYFNGTNWKYVSSSYALYAYQDRSAGKHVWATAASGTAGNNITWTEAMTLDASGALILNNAGGDANMYFGGSSGTNRMYLARSGVDSLLINVETTGALRFGTNGTERARIDSSGTFIIKNDYQEQTYTANSSTAITLNITTNGTDQVITLTGTATITMPTAVAGKSFLLKLKTGAGGYTVTWSTVKWPGGTAPTLTSTASKMDIFSFFSDGTNWYGTTVGQNYTP